MAMLFSVTAPLAAREVRVGVLIDGPSAREGISADALEQAAAAVFGDGLRLTVAPETRLNGNWNVSTLNAALDRLEADPQVDVVVTLGFAASYLVAHRAQLPKPHHCGLRSGPFASDLSNESRHERPSQFHLRYQLQ